ncbi:hypothetical protein CSC67_07585 [Pusillimonas caeni]|uniref:Fic/DOC family protein n=1 Tax=Pusillimonas caeni TaxID=1348472 RepID=UPI000E59E1C6|nr:Fic/DOC family protein [Pusillimonas caeni]TFL14025.1 hypothetical protein CSC67_07585 [Pusillimonas caeni]
MNKYSEHPSDPYFDATHGILRNRLNITDAAELERVEAALVAVRSVELALDPVKGCFDLKHLQQIHHRLFSDVYDWAGQIRTVDVSKGSTRFAHHAHIESYAPQITELLARERHLQGLSPADFSERAGHYLGELNVLHPFREGNGRSLREFINQLSHQAGYHISWQGIDKEANIQASIAAFQGDSSQLARLISANLVDYDRQRAIDLARDDVGADSRIVAAQENQAYTGRILGLTDRYVIQALPSPSKDVVLHERRTLSASASLLPGQVVRVAYPHGRVGLVTEPAQNDLNIQRTMDRGFER